MDRENVKEQIENKLTNIRDISVAEGHAADRFEGKEKVIVQIEFEPGTDFSKASIKTSPNYKGFRLHDYEDEDWEPDNRIRLLAVED